MEPSQPPSAELAGIQFGLATTNEILGFSVLESKEHIGSLVDSRLGLPAEDERCATCGGTNFDECTGHFAHLKLTQPIYHPNHMRLVQRILQKICLACGVPKAEKKKAFSDEAVHRKQRPQGVEDTNREREPLVAPGAGPIERAPVDPVILLSSDEDEVFPGDILRVSQGPMDFLIGSTSRTGTAQLPKLRNRKSKGKAHVNESLHAEVMALGGKKSAGVKSRSMKGLEKTYKGSPAGFDVLNADTHRTAKTSKTFKCLHCSPGYPDYRSILVKILPVKRREKNDFSQILLLEVQGADKEDEFDLPDDFWAFLKGGVPHDDESEVPKRHILTPSEALTILKKISESAIGKLGMNELVARPEGLILKCVPVPPNCTRTTDYKYVNNTIAVRFGTDKVTRTLQNLLTEVNRIHRTRGGRALQRVQREESKSLQILTADYLREKGAPKAVPAKEPLKKDRHGRFTKQDDHRWTKEWLTQNILGKGGNYTARAVIAGDPSIGIEEIGVPWEIAQKLTLPIRATQWNRTKLQEYVDRTQTLQGSGNPGATRIERHGEAFQVWANSTHEVQIGDVVHRNILDGDYVFVNRPPSVHKHSLMALKVRVHYGLVLTINPLVCPPFNADFDGDIFHVFIPQSLQAIAELEQLMAVSQQMVSDHGGQPLFGLTQDTLLAAHLLTSSKLFVDKASMDQLCVWSSKQPPEAAIVKSPKGGPFWTGEQVFGLTLPADLELGTPDDKIFIQGGQITKWIDGTKMLRKDNDSIASALCVKVGPLALVDHLDTATGVLHAWLQVQGFSTGLTDFQVTNNQADRQKMLESIFEEYYVKGIKESCDSVRILDAKVQAMDPDTTSSPEGLTKNVRFLEQAAQHIFRTRESDAENEVLKYAEKNNSLLLMVKSGSKGSRGKLLQQIAGMGLQLYKGKHLLPVSGSRRPLLSNSPVLDWWEDKGLVRSSLVDGLKAPELFNHVIADRTGILRKHLEVVQPGTLFKSLMLFLRDLHVMYDGSVRSHCGKNLVQFCYGGAVGVRRRTFSEEGSNRNQVGMEYPTAPGDGSLKWEEDDCKRWPLSVLAGEPVGILAATAISQPAYELMLDAPNLNGPFKPRPLELVQETLYPREKSDLKCTDRCVIIRLVSCECTKPLCLERRVLDVQAHLKRITLKAVAQSSAIEFWNMEDFEAAGPTGEELRLGSPWLGHIKLSLELMEHHQVTIEDIVMRLRHKFSGSIENPKKNPMGQIFFCCSHNCCISNGYCLHFSPRLPSKMQNQRNEEIYNAALQSLLMKIRGTVIPGLLDSTVKGDERLESVRIVSEGSSWTTWHDRVASKQNLDEELVLEIIVSPTKSKSKRSMAWSAVKQACLPLMEMVDWNRSMPYSIQEIRHALGVEVAYQTVMRRLGLALEVTAPHTHPVHVKLIADMMTFSGDANGFTFSGFQDLNKSTGVSAPFTEASIHKPIRTLLDAAGRGATDSVEGVMASCVWGKEAPVGTGSSFDLFWKPSKDLRGFATTKEAEKDVHMVWKDLDENCIPDRIIPPSPAHSLPGLRILPGGDMDLDDEAGFSPHHASKGNDADDIWGSFHANNNIDDGGWGNSPVAREDGGGWGTVGVASDVNDRGGWEQDGLTSTVKGQGGEVEGGWGSVTKESSVTRNGWDDINGEHVGGGWGGSATQTSTGNEDGWGGSATQTSTGNEDGWDSVSNEKGISVDNQKNRQADAEGGWGRVAAPRTSEGGWGDEVDGKVDEPRAEPDQGGWGSPSKDVAGTTTDVGNWGAISGAESGGGGWDSVSTAVVTGDSQTKGPGADGWDSIALENVTTHTKPRPGRGGDRSERASDRHGTTADAGNWGAISGAESEGGGWDSVSTAVVTRDSQTKGPGADGWDAVPLENVTTHTERRPGCGGDWNEPSTDRHGNRPYNGDWSERASDRQGNRFRNRDWSEPPSYRGDNGGRGRYSSAGAMSRTFRQAETEPECKEIHDIAKSMRQILWNLKNETGGRLSDEDDEAVQAVLTYHPSFIEKAGCGIAYIKVDNSPDYPDVRCFWLVRTDGSETDFSYRKCIREKVGREFPTFLDRYDELYTRKRPPVPDANLPVEDTPADQAAETNLTVEEKPAEQAAETDTQAAPLEETGPTTEVD